MADQPDQQDIASDSDHALEDGGRGGPEPEASDDEYEGQHQHGSSSESNSSDDLQDAPIFDLDEAAPLPDQAAVVMKRPFSVEVTEDGDKYYVDSMTSETTWELPDDGEVVEI